MDTHMPTTMDTTMARGPLMLSPPLPLSPRLMLMLFTDTDTDLVTTDMAMLTMDTMDTHMPTMDTTARGPLMPSPPLPLSPRLMLMLFTDTDTDLLTTDTTMARGLLMPSPLLMLPMDTMDMDITSAMPTMDTMPQYFPAKDTSMDKMDIIINLFVKN